MGVSGNVDVLKRNRKWFFSRYVQFDSGFNVMAVCEVSCNGHQKSLLASASSSVESSWCGDGDESPSDSPRRFPCSSLRSGWSLIKVDVLRRWSPPETLTVPSAAGKTKLTHFIGVRTSFCIEPSGVEFTCVHLLHFFNVCDNNVSFPDSLRIQYITEEHTWQELDTQLIESR